MRISTVMGNITSLGQSTGAPQAMWPAWANSTSLNFSWWPPTTQTAWGVGEPDYYQVWRNGVLIPMTASTPSPPGLTNNGVTPNPTVSNPNTPPRNYAWFTDNGLTPGTTYSYTIRAVTGSTVSVDGPTLTMSTLANTPSANPTPPTDPATWIQPFSTPVGTVFTCTNLTAGGTSISGTIFGDVAGTDNPAGNGKGNQGCSFQHALSNANINGGDVIVLTAGATYPVSSSANSGYIIPAFNGTAGWTYIISSATPEYAAGGALVPYSFITNFGFTPVALTAAPALGATSATLATPWTQKTGWYYVIFTEGTTQEERQVVFTKGSSAISWVTTNGLLALTTPSGVPLAAAASATILVAAHNYVTPADIPNMATISWGATGNSSPCFKITQDSASSVNKLRLVGINMQPAPGGTQSALNVMTFTPWSQLNTPATQPRACESLYLDRCMFGNDTNDPGWMTIGHGLVSVNANHFLVHQSYIWGVVQNTTTNLANDSNGIGLADGGPFCFQNNYLQAGAENIIFGGGPMAPPPNFCHDAVVRYNFSHKPRAWIGGNPTWFNVITVNGGTLQTPWAYPSGAYDTHFLDAGPPVTHRRPTGNFIQGSATVTWVGAPITLINPSRLNVGVLSTTPWGRFGQAVKNHLELKGIDRAEYYGNLILNGWMGEVQSYHSAAFACGARDQNAAAGISAANVPNITATCPWIHVNDVWYHDNQAYKVGSLIYIFTGDYDPTSWSGRIKLTNNVCLSDPIASDNSVGERTRTIQIQGPIPDLIIDHNTWITNTSQFNTNLGIPIGIWFVSVANTPGTYGTPAPYGPNPGWDLVNDRFTFTNNIADSGIGGNLAIAFNPAPCPKFDAYINYIINANLTINDTTTYVGTGTGANFVPGTINHVPYGSLGMRNFQGNTLIPTDPSDWNIISGIYATAGTDGKSLGATFPALQFPLLGGYLIGSPVQTSFGQAAFQQQIAGLGAAVIGTYPNWSGGGFTNATAAGAVKAINPNIKLTQYTKIMETNSDWPAQGTAGFGPMYTQINNNNYWLRATYPAGSIEVFGGHNMVNIFDTAWQSWVATWSAANVWAANFDGVYTDNVFFQPNTPGDFLKNGSTQTAVNSATGWRNAYAAYFPLLRAALPTGANQCWGNVADWATDHTTTGYSQMLNGGVLESAIGQSYSWETTSWVYLMNNYAKVMNAVIRPGYVIFEQDNASATAYAAMRYGLCSCLMDNAYFYYNISGAGGGNVITRFDEFDFNLGVAFAGPNNASNGTYSSGALTVWQNGVWRRDFANGIVLVNPRGNGAKTVTLEANYWHLRGTQDPTTNNAQKIPAGTAVSMPDPNVAGTGGSGLILSRTAT